MNNLKNQKGVTIIALAITVVVIIIIAGITVKFGTDAIKTAKVESLMTNMITIKAKGKGYVEEVNAQIWDLAAGEKNQKRNELFEQKFKMTENTSELTSCINTNLINTNECVAYSITKETLNLMGLEELANNTEDNEYAIVFDLSDFTKFDVLYKDGVDYQKNTY